MMNYLDHPDMQEPQNESNINVEKVENAPADEAVQSVLANNIQESRIAQENEANLLKLQLDDNDLEKQKREQSLESCTMSGIEEIKKQYYQESNTLLPPKEYSLLKENMRKMLKYEKNFVTIKDPESGEELFRSYGLLTPKSLVGKKSFTDIGKKGPFIAAKRIDWCEKPEVPKDDRSFWKKMTEKKQSPEFGPGKVRVEVLEACGISGGNVYSLGDGSKWDKDRLSRDPLSSEEAFFSDFFQKTLFKGVKMNGAGSLQQEQIYNITTTFLNGKGLIWSKLHMQDDKLYANGYCVDSSDKISGVFAIEDLRKKP